MMELTELQLSLLKEIELDILKDIDLVCRKNNINYSLSGGTLIGAIRHKGFIPWDDDIDIMMLREDYEKFEKIADRELDDKFYFVNYKNNSNYPMPFAKVMAKNTVMHEIAVSDASTANGVYVDVFIFDAAETNSIKLKLQRSLALRLRNAMICRSGNNVDGSIVKKIVYSIRHFFLNLVPKKFFIYLTEKNSKKVRFEDTEYLISLNGIGGMPLQPKSLVESFIDIDFEGEIFKCFADYDSYLKNRYGDYMKLPPKEEQIPHHSVKKIELDKYFK